MFEGILQPTHLILVLIIVLVVFGPGKLPEIGSALGKSLREFKHSVSEFSGSSQAAPAVEGPIQAATGTACKACHTENPAGNEFCKQCGQKLS